MVFFSFVGRILFWLAVLALMLMYEKHGFYLFVLIDEFEAN